MTTMLVSTLGGHLSQLHSLVPRLSGIDTDDRVWVTHDSAQSRSLLEGEDVIWVPYIDERDLNGVARAVGPALSLIADRHIDVAVSTGSAIAVAYLGAARLRRRRAVFIESAAFVRSHSRTGRALRMVPGVTTLTQSAANTSARWSHRGSVLDGYRAEVRPDFTAPRRIVVTVGTSRRFGYRRLIERLVRIVPDDVEVLWQTGCTDVDDLPIEARPWLPYHELLDATRAADVVIAHAGGGSALTTIAAGRRPVLVPRSAAAHDFADDHQYEIADLLAARDLATVATVEQLSWDLISEAARWRVERHEEPPPIDIGPGR